MKYFLFDNVLESTGIIVGPRNGIELWAIGHNGESVDYRPVLEVREV